MEGSGRPEVDAPLPPSAAVQRTLEALRLRVKEYDMARAQDRLTIAVVRGACAGLAVRGGLHAVSYLAGRLMRSRRREQPSSGPTPVERLVETLRYGAFLGTFGGVYVSADELIAMLLGRSRTRGWRSLLAGLLAGPSILLTGPGSNHTSLAMYVFLRGLVLLVRCGNLPGGPAWRRRLLAPTRATHGDVALMCLAVTQLGYSWMVTPKTLPGAYIRFLNKHGGKPTYMYAAIREMMALQRRGEAHPPRPLTALRGTPHAGFRGVIPCSFLHEGETCSQATLAFAPEAYMRALPVYFPVYLIPALFVHRQRLLDPRVAPELWRRLVLGMLRSSAFLTLFCVLAWRSVCLVHNVAGRTTGPLFMLACGAGGLSLLAEKKSRRMDIALYCLSRGAESGLLNLQLADSALTRHLPRRLDVILFSVATAAILHCYSDHWGERRDVIRGTYLSVFDFILGNTGFQSAEVRHSPSNREMLGRINQSQPMQMVRSLSSHAFKRIRSSPRVDSSQLSLDFRGEGEDGEPESQSPGHEPGATRVDEEEVEG
ncbi:hypothetical protein F751_2263 [Auxenochlorella protothecoides]|uniref:Transmembrane protein 135 N-terminal domain-containing protein n=1 Tax=Auxenochlorella protothecoides TaxID=3075 RepID=A0A087SFP1_AUXPR|nr:hypothetical protein F751_2263 [Auxenochlorella protothecoides]KFM24545.1 hypothetical protein F751_2263 [Auxenochlorella protothecoides]